MRDLEQSLRSLRTQLGEPPAGYLALIAKFGGATFGGVSLFPPRLVIQRTHEARVRCLSYWFWGEGEQVRRDRMSRAILFADSPSGDELWAFPAGEGPSFLLLRDAEEPTIDQDFEAAFRKFAASELGSSSALEQIERKPLVDLDIPVAQSAGELRVSVSVALLLSRSSDFPQLVKCLASELGLPSSRRGTDEANWRLSAADGRFCETLHLEHIDYREVLCGVVEAKNGTLRSRLERVLANDLWDAHFARDAHLLTVSDACKAGHPWFVDGGDPTVRAACFTLKKPNVAAVKVNDELAELFRTSGLADLTDSNNDARTYRANSIRIVARTRSFFSLQVLLVDDAKDDTTLLPALAELLKANGFDLPQALEWQVAEPHWVDWGRAELRS
jgi:hypothetical protein